MGRTASPPLALVSGSMTLCGGGGLLKQLEGRIVELPTDTVIVAYCRGPYCVLAPDAARILSRHGRPARTLAAGFPPMETSRASNDHGIAGFDITNLS